jgi:hypothetical protein
MSDDKLLVFSLFGLLVSVGGVLILRNRRSFTRMNPFLDDDENSVRWRFALALNTAVAIVLVVGGIASVIIALANMRS